MLYFFLAELRAPKLVTREHLRSMRPGSVFVDVAIDQGGVGETSRPTTHDDPVYVEEGVVHYCVANMPGAYARTSTIALANATVGYGVQLASKGTAKACEEKSGSLQRAFSSQGKNNHSGRCTDIQDGRRIYGDIGSTEAISYLTVCWIKNFMFCE